MASSAALRAVLRMVNLEILYLCSFRACCNQKGRLHVTYVSSCHISREKSDLGRKEILQLLKPIGRSGNKDDILG